MTRTALRLAAHLAFLGLAGVYLISVSAHPLCLTMPCESLSCDVWAIDPIEPGGHVQVDRLRAASCRWVSAQCTEAGPEATFEITSRNRPGPFRIVRRPRNLPLGKGAVLLQKVGRAAGA